MKDHEARIARLERAPGGGSIFVDSRVLEAAADHVLFDAIPSGRTILELAWFALLDDASVGDPCYSGLFLNGDAIANEWTDESEYRWNIGIPNPIGPDFVSVHSNEEFAAVGWINLGMASFGRIQFPAYNIAGGEWHGDSSINNGNDTIPGVCSGARDDSGTGFVLSALSMIALAESDFARQQFAVGSWFALTAY